MEAGRGTMGAQPVGVDAFGPMREMAQTMSMLNQIRTQNAQFSARQHLGEIAATSPDMNTALSRMQASAAWPFAPEVLAQAREAEMMRTQQAHIEQTMATDGMQFWLKFGPLLQSNPEEYGRLRRAFGAALPPGAASARTLQAIDTLEESQTANIPEHFSPEQAQMKQWQRQWGMGMAAGYSPEALAAAYGRPDLLNAGGALYPIWRGGALSGGPYGGGPGGIAFTGGGVTTGVAPSWTTGPEGVPVLQPGIPGGQIIPPPGFAPLPQGGAVAAPPGGPDYSPGAVTTAPLAPPAGIEPSATAAPGQAPATPAATAPSTPTPSPAAPAGAPGAPPGVPQAQIPWQQVRTAQYLKAGQDHYNERFKELSDRVTAEYPVLQSIAEMRDLMKDVRPGPEQAWRYPLATFAKKIGASDAIVRGIEGGDLGKAQELQKFFVTNVMGQLRQNLPPGSRLNLMEWSAFSRNNPNLETLPDAIERIFNFWTKQYDFNRTELEQMPQYVSRGGDPFQWDAEWSHRATGLGFISPATGIQPRPEPGAPPAPGTRRSTVTPAPTLRWNPSTRTLEPVPAQ